MLKAVMTICMCALVASCASHPVASGPVADAIYDNARIWTGSPEQPWAGSLAVIDGRIVAMGESGALDRWRGASTAYHNLDGRLVTPGFQDSHIHIIYSAAPQVDLAGAETLGDFQGRVKAFATANPDLPWILGFGWGYGAFPNQIPHSRYLDTLVPDRPVFVTSRDGHMSLANTKAMQMAGINENTPDPENGRIVRADDGAATGELQESAAYLVRKLIPEPTEEDRYQALLRNMEKAAANGITAFHEAGVLNANIPLFERAVAEGKMRQRVELALRMVSAEDRNVVPAERARTHAAVGAALRERFDGPFVRVRSIKGMLDGTIDATTAYMFENFVGTDTAGIPFWEVDVLQEVVAIYDKAGFQVILHAIGDRSISEALDTFAHAREVNGVRDSRHRVEHAEIPRLSDLARFRNMGVIASTQPMFAYPDTTVLQNFAVLLGHERCQHADNFALWDQAGVRQVFGSDSPVMTMSVLKGIEAAVTRMTESGTPAGGWYPQGRISVEAALRHYTSDAAWGVHDEQDRGTLEVGKFADFVVLSDNILEIDPTQISETQVLKTVMNGNVTFDAL